MAKILTLFLFIIINISTLLADDTKTEIKVNNFLVLGPFEVSIPSGGDGDLTSLLKFENIDVRNWWPIVDDKIPVDANSFLKWKEYGDTDLQFEETKYSTIYYAGFFINSNRWAEVELEIKSCAIYSVYLDGLKIEEKNEFNESNMNCEPGKLSTKLEIETGKHLVLIKFLFDPNKNSEWAASSSIYFERKYDRSIAVTTNPLRTTTIADLLDNKSVTSISLSPDGKIVALKLKQRNKIKDTYDNWIELRNTVDGSLIWTFKGGMDLPDVKWAPNSNSVFAYSTSSGDDKSLWLVDIEKGTTEALLTEVKNMGGFEWAENGEYLVYTVSETVEQDDLNFKKYDLPEDRWPGFRAKQFMYRVFPKSKMSERLTAGDESTDFIQISPDSKKILYSKTYYGQSKRPYYRNDYFILDLESMQVDSIFSPYFSTGVSWSPDSKKLLVLGGSTSFGNIGNNLPENVIPNDFDTQAYIYDIDTKDVIAITKDFNPKIDAVKWDGNSNVIYFLTTDQSYKNLYRYHVAEDNFELIDLNTEVVEEIHYSADYMTAIFRASSSNIPEKIYKADLQSEEVKLFYYPAEEQYENVKFGKVEDWDFTSSTGQKIKGRIYYPPNFDKHKKYPALVYYYAGTSPIERDFGGRYPKNIWTANGYVVYTLQPSGAYGFGTEFSAKHVNDWGTITAQEIIEGTQKFVEEHEFVDSEKLGCLGASYGGFETMSLITKTDLFSAAISHAGISNLTSYWGVGYWGYWYNSVAAAESFPWNRKDIYVDKSPLFNADKINTPLLLLQGNTDPNVPPGEAIQMYVALKHLGKDVELIEVDKQQHWILDYDKRVKWNDTILAYFDKYLKGQPEWWNKLYK